MRLTNFFSPSLGQFMIAVSCCLLVASLLLFPPSVGISELRAELAVLGTGYALGQASPNDQGKPKPIGDYRRDLKSFLKRSKLKDEPVQRFGAVVDLCLLHSQIVGDSRFQTSQQLKSFRAVAAERLKKCRREIEVEIKRANRALAQRQKEDRSKDRRKIDGDEDLFDDDRGKEEPLAELQNRWLVEDMDSVTRITGGPIRFWSYTGGNFAGPLCDHGPDLVRLIETTINPDFWQSNGGNGVIHYYQPLRVLVVSASSQVHDDMTALLRTLRNNSR